MDIMIVMTTGMNGYESRAMNRYVRIENKIFTSDFDTC